ncbi:MAG: hypothetical protein EVB00_00060 [SAR86 cluster bacterium]|uniref:Uncharacterized protein n=1 Tax=SAR86 cluster bacterium TaxID=2030880 RepID=A0A520MD20_9GAMM|nr:MAG: hypothetical protein EVB00_00060 [SAR86 cluster bacterium]
MKKLTSILICSVASFNLSAHGEGILSLHIHGESIAGLALIFAIFLVVPMYFLLKLSSVKEK